MKNAILLTALLVTVSQCVFAGFDEGLTAYRRQDYATALREWKPLAEHGDAAAQYGLGIMYYQGRGVTQDSAQALRWIRKSAEAGNVTAQNTLGDAYLAGRDVPQDYQQAVFWTRKAADQGNARAEYNLGVYYQDGQGVERDDAKAVAWYRKATEQGYAPAQYNLGQSYGTGRGVPQDYQQAMAWTLKAAEQAYVPAWRTLGTAYQIGQGVPIDTAKALEWNRKAAEAGDAWAQTALGNMYRLGKGVPRDYAQTVSWYRKGAEGGDEVAQANLGAMYYEGKGVPQSFEQSYMWSSVAVANGMGAAVKNRNAAAAHLNPTQIAEAQTMAKDWLALHTPSSAKNKPPIFDLSEVRLALHTAASANTPKLSESDRAGPEQKDKTYTSPTYHWSIHYPADWSINTSNPQLILVRSTIGNGLCSIVSHFTRFTTLDEHTDFMLTDQQRFIKDRGQEQIILSRTRIALPNDVTGNDVLKEIRPGGKSRQIYLLKGETGFGIDCETYLADWPSLDRTYDRIINSFTLEK